MPEMTEYKDQIIRCEIRKYPGYPDELRIYADHVFMDFPLPDDTLPTDIQTQPTKYLLCARRFEPGKTMSRTGLTSVWFEQADALDQET